MPLWWGGGARAAFLLGSGGGCGCGGRRESGLTSTSLRLRSMAGVDSRSAKLGARPRPTFLQWCLRPGLRVGHLLRLDKACGRWSFVRSWAMAMATAAAAAASSDGAAGWGKGPGTSLQFRFCCGPFRKVWWTAHPCIPDVSVFVPSMYVFLKS